MSTAHTTVQKTGPKVQLLRRSPVDLGQPLCGPIVSSRHGFVSSAGMHIKRAQPIPAIAASNVVCGHATVASVSASGCSDVYDITVDGAHEFFANGILVHNCDELSSWRYPDTWYLGLLPTLRDPRTTPHVVVTSTPKPVQLLRSLVDEEMSEHGTTVVTRGSTFDNAANLAPQFLDEMRNRYEGTRRGRQELYGELLTDVDGALVNIDMIDNTRLREFPDIRMVRIVVAVDPATTSGEDSDETGIVVVARGSDGRGYVLDDLSCKETPDGWARIVARAYEKYSADRVVAEKNQGGDMVETIVRSVHPNISYKSISAKVGKKLRAEPIAALYEQGKISHIGYFPQLEDQWTTWVPDQRGQRSPDRVDALVHGLTELGLVGASSNNFKEWMESEHPPCVACGTPAPRGTPTCQKCGADRADPGLPEPEAVPDPWSLSSRPTNRVVPNPHTQAVMEALKVYAPRTFGPFGPFGSFDR